MSRSDLIDSRESGGGESLSTGDCTLGAGSDEDSDNIRSRPLAADHDNTDIHISMHTNGYQGDCFGGSCPNGTCTYYDSTGEHADWGAISQALAQDINTGIVDAIRNRYTDSTWRDRGALNASGSFAETRIPNRAAVLIELAFHDSCDRDGLYLQDNFFRSATMWGAYKGVCDYFGVTPTYDFYSYEIVSDTIPRVMEPGQTYSVSITLRNRGVLWTEAKAIDASGSMYADAAKWEYRGVAVAPTITQNPQAQSACPGTSVAKTVAASGSVPQTDPDCTDAHLDGDSDVDDGDFLIFFGCMTGPDLEGDPACTTP